MQTGAIAWALELQHLDVGYITKLTSKDYLFVALGGTLRMKSFKSISLKLSLFYIVFG